ncbi:hypothetical protein YC2023_001367 [Brassica napus]
MDLWTRFRFPATDDGVSCIGSKKTYVNFGLYTSQDLASLLDRQFELNPIRPVSRFFFTFKPCIRKNIIIIIMTHKKCLTTREVFIAVEETEKQHEQMKVLNSSVQFVWLDRYRRIKWHKSQVFLKVLEIDMVSTCGSLYDLINTFTESRQQTTSFVSYKLSPISLDFIHCIHANLQATGIEDLFHNSAYINMTITYSVKKFEEQNM